MVDVERWAHIEELYHAALERDPRLRSEFLDRACSGDEELRRELESLLGQDDSSRAELLNGPAWHHAELNHSTLTGIARGTQLGPYRIEGLLGAGGMGKVYCALDTRLGRAVAIKISAEKFTDRFEREARAISALNHPNICTLYDIGPKYLVMELVEGETLASRLKTGPLPLKSVLRYGEQIAYALAAAHRKGIIHRDLKPGNIMLTNTGVKVLDFGLAKCVQDDTLTASRVVMGTPAYMSPEQRQGKECDTRTDIYALGLVLYEMATGEQASSSTVDLASRSASRLRGPLPRPLRRLVGRMLEKDPACRIQAVEEIALELGRLQRPPRLSPIAVGSAVALLFACVAIWRFAGTGTSARRIEYTRLTNFPDSVHSPALSRDGKMLAFIRGPVEFISGPGEVYVKVLPDGQPVALTHDGTTKVAPKFTSDNSKISYTSITQHWSTFTVPVSGGEPTLFMPNAAALNWIGRGQVLFSELKRAPHMGIVASTESRGDARDVYLPASPIGMAHFSEISPDRKWVLIIEMGTGWTPCRLVPFDGSSQGKQVGPPAGECTAAAWSRDGRWMYFAAAVDGETHLWKQAFPDGRPEQLTSGFTQERGVAVDPIDGSLITSVGSAQSTVWLHDRKGERALSAEGYAYRPLVSADGKTIFYLIRRAARGAFWAGELWSVDTESGRNERLPLDFLVRNYDVSRDGRYIVFDTFDKMERSRIWVAPVDRSSGPRQMTPGAGPEELQPVFGARNTIYFVQERGSNRFLYRMNLDGSGRKQVSTQRAVSLVSVSPDEKWAVLYKNGEGALFVPVAGGSPKLLCECSVGPIFQDPPRVNWSHDGQWLYVAGELGKAGTSVIPWRGLATLSLAASSQGKISKIPGATTTSEIGIAPGRTGSEYAFTRGSEQSNLYRLRFRVQ